MMVHNGQIPMFISEPEAVSFFPCTNTVQPSLPLCLTTWALSSQKLFRNKGMKKEKATSSSLDHKQHQSCHFIAFFHSSFAHSLSTEVILFFLPAHYSQLALSLRKEQLRCMNKHYFLSSGRKSWISFFVAASWQCRTPHSTVTSRSVVNYCDHSLPHTSCRTPRWLSHLKSDGLLKYFSWSNCKIGQTTISFN